MSADLDERFRPPPELRPAVRAICESLIDAMRPAALECGYALAVHGSMERDLDVLAVPWVPKAKTPRQLARALAKSITARRGKRWLLNGHPPTEKPHGRMAFTIIAFDDDGVHSRAGTHPFVDLSVMPRQP